jgi:lipopolysaccharide heptosyltransferase II
MRENILTATLARVASVPFRLLGRRPFTPPQKLLILRPCCLSQVMLATPLLAALSEAFPSAQIDWAVSEYARPAVATNVRLSELIDTGRVGLPDGSWRDVRDLARRLREQRYDTCVIPSRSSMLAAVAWMAGIPQRIGISQRGRGFAHTLAVAPPAGESNTATIYLEITRALGIEAEGQMEFYPTDRNRQAMTQFLVDEVNWLGDVPLVMFHPGGGQNPVASEPEKRWPSERFVLLGNHLIRTHNARILLLGSEEEKPLAEAIAGMMSGPALNLAGRISLGELGALAEMADLYVGNDTGPTHVAAAVGCPTLALFGPSQPARSAPYATKGQVIALGGPAEEPFAWEDTVPAPAALAAVDRLLAKEEGDADSVETDD